MLQLVFYRVKKRAFEHFYNLEKLYLENFRRHFSISRNLSKKKFEIIERDFEKLRYQKEIFRYRYFEISKFRYNILLDKLALKFYKVNWARLSKKSFTISKCPQKISKFFFDIQKISKFSNYQIKISKFLPDSKISKFYQFSKYKPYFDILKKNFEIFEFGKIFEILFYNFKISRFYRCSKFLK